MIIYGRLADVVGFAGWNLRVYLIVGGLPFVCLSHGRVSWEAIWLCHGIFAEKHLVRIT